MRSYFVVWTRKATVACGLTGLVAGCVGGAVHREPALDERAAAARDSGVATFASGDLQLRVEALRDDLVHFELTSQAVNARRARDDGAPIPTSPMVYRKAARMRWARRDDAVLETAELRLEIDRASLCVRVTDLRRGFLLHRVCPRGSTQLAISREHTENIYGLGEQFVTAGTPDGDWIGKKRTSGNEHGNAMVKFDGNEKGSGSVGNTQFPILYAVGPAKQSYAMFVDDAYAEQWSFAADPWTLQTAGDDLRWYVMSGPDLPDLRRDMMDLLGRPPVPPRKAFGLWISEYGFDDWKELEGKLRTLRANHFPVDGFVLDLQWFGIKAESETSHMGTLSWDRAHFPDPERKIAELREREGIGLILIEESYVSRGLPEHAELARRGFLARDCASCPPTYLAANSWWGKGGMIDWSNAEAAAYWHDVKRRPLVEMGVLGHWCDLGEPEMYSPTSVYAGVADRHRHIDVHNLFSFLWIESIARGYTRQGSERRPFMMARSGAPGLQRYGASMWSGDIGSNLTTLAAHFNAQMQMSMSGIDYFGADIGGFIREPLRGDMNETYTQWFADGMAVDVPGRVHTWNTENNRETAPDRLGHVPSNLANVRRRYELVPYIYSLAHRAWRDGDPVFPPLVWAYQDDPEVRRIGGEKLVGRDLLVALVARDGARTHDVYLPQGTWYDLDGRGRLAGGQWLRGLPLYDDGHVFRLPMFARAGAILPLAFVDDQTWNVMGKRGDGTRRSELRLRVFASTDAAPTTFTHVEDDGETVRYQRGELRTTELSQRTETSARRLTVSIASARGSYAGAPTARDAVVEVVLPEATKPKSVVVDGVPLPEMGRAGDVDTAKGWKASRPGFVVVRAGESPVTSARSVVIEW